MGISVRFTVPTGVTVGCSFGLLEYTGSIGSCTISLSDAVGGFTDTPYKTLGVGQVSISGGINLAGKEKDLIPGETYFMNIRWTDGVGRRVFIRHVYQEQ